jgi:hypothetical protein
MVVGTIAMALYLLVEIETKDTDVLIIQMMRRSKKEDISGLDRLHKCLVSCVGQ